MIVSMKILHAHFRLGFRLSFFAMMVTLVLSGALPSWAQTTQKAQAPAKIFKASVRATDSITLVAKNTPITLWGVDMIGNMPATFNLRARTSLDNSTLGSKIECEIKKREGQKIFAQCVNREDLDLGLSMIQKGYVVVNRTLVYGTVFEDAYIQAEKQAQNDNLGVWAQMNTPQGGSDTSSEDKLMIGLGLGLFIFIIIVFFILSIIIMRGFQKVIDAQNDNVKMMNQERKLRKKERQIVAIMLSSELKANKSKIEAYLVVYEEVLNTLTDTGKEPRYKISGDIIQKQPALDRAIFDRNADKLDALGPHLSSELIHFYARIKSAPEFVNLEPETALGDAIKIVEGAVESARRMNKLSDRLIEAFIRNDAQNLK